MPRGAVWAAGVAASLLAGCLHAPVLWSPDGRWLAYTLAVRPGAGIPSPGWLFQTSPAKTIAPTPAEPGRGAASRVYRLWTTRVDTGASVLLEESTGPITSPGWSPDGRALAFGRLRWEADGRVRFEVVVQDGPDHQRVLFSRPHADLPARSADLPGLGVAWSPDGRYLAVPLFQQTLDLAVVRADNGRLLKVVENAYLPAWSPDGSKLAFVRGGDAESLQSLDHHFGPTRQLADIGQTTQPPAWSRDGQSVVVIRQPAQRADGGPTPLAELIRVRVETGAVESIFKFESAPLAREKTFLGASFGADRDGDTLFFSRDIEGEPTEIAWFRVRNKEIYKKFHPIDPGVRVGALAVSPTEKLLALRVGSPGNLSPPGVVDLSTDRLTFTPIVPDDAARVEWLTTYIDAARGLLQLGLPPVAAGPGRPVERPTLLPIPVELDEPARHEVQIRLRRLGRLGRPLCDRPADSPPAEPALAAFLDEARLFLDYLRQDYAAALASLDRLEERVSQPDQRLRLLSVRAQILMGKGEHEQSWQTISFLRSLRRGAPLRFEQTPAGPVLTPQPDPGRGWPDYLAGRAEQRRAKAAKGGEAGDDPLNPFGHVNPDAPEPPMIEGPAIEAPFAPIRLEGLPPARPN
jgi:Tol biopolymer transport system component